eukprot:353502-Chlamydomonas_euryale.AAC.1
MRRCRIRISAARGLRGRKTASILWLSGTRNRDASHPGPDPATAMHRGRGARGPGTKPRPIAPSCVAMRVASWRVARGCIRSSRPELG